MMTEAKICNFEKNPVTFLLSKENGVMVNATEMAKIFGKEVARFMENDSTKNFINSCLKTRNSSFLNVKNVEDLYTSKQKSGTFMHRILALKFAAWLDPDFEVWVYSTIEEILFGKHVEREKSFERTLSLQAELSELEYKVNKTGEDFERYLYLRKELSREKSYRTSLTKESLEEMQSLFYDEKGGEA